MWLDWICKIRFWCVFSVIQYNTLYCDQAFYIDSRPTRWISHTSSWTKMCFNILFSASAVSVPPSLGAGRPALVVQCRAWGPSAPLALPFAQCAAEPPPPSLPPLPTLQLGQGWRGLVRSSRSCPHAWELQACGPGVRSVKLHIYSLRELQVKDIKFNNISLAMKHDFCQTTRRCWGEFTLKDSKYSI